VSRFKALLALALLVSLGACSVFDSDEEQDQPAELISFEAEREFDKIWSRGIGNGQGAKYNRLTPAIDGQYIVAAAADGTVSRMRLEDGEQQWSISLEQSLLAGVGVGDKQVLVATIAGNIIAIDKDSGEQLWSAQVGGEVLSPPQSEKGKIFVQTVDGKMLALSAEDGSQLWSFTNNVPVLTLRGTSTPLLFRDAVIAGFANGNVVSFKQQTGTVQWTSRVSIAKGNSEIDRIVDVDGNLLVSSSLLYASNYQGRIVAIDPKSGSRAWANEASSNGGMSTGFGNIYVSGADGSITAFEKNGNGVRWAQTLLSNRVITGSVTQGSYVVVADFEGYLHALSQVDGHMAGRTKLGADGIRVDLLSAKDRIVAYGNDGTLAVYRLK
jgi:outer membrane protein assembly factor BamB